jgi:hypothetical protein
LRIILFGLRTANIDDELRVATKIKPMNPMLNGDAHVFDECLLFHHIVGCSEVQPNHVEESVTIGEISTMPPPASLRVKEPLKYML